MTDSTKFKAWHDKIYYHCLYLFCVQQLKTDYVGEGILISIERRLQNFKQILTSSTIPGVLGNLLLNNFCQGFGNLLNFFPSTAVGIPYPNHPTKVFWEGLDPILCTHCSPKSQFTGSQQRSL